MNQNKKHPPLLLEAASEWLAAGLRSNRIPLTASFVWAALAYMFAFTNKLINHDEAGQLFSKGATVSSGRWGLGLMDIIFPNVSMPWIYGVFTVFFVAIAICLIIHLFQIRSRVIQVLLAGCIMVFPSLIGTIGYMFTSSSYALSFLLAVLSVFLIRKWIWLPALVCLVGSISIYQSYVSVAASLLVLVLIRMLLTGEDPLPVLKRGIGYVLFLVVSLGLYYLANQIILTIKHISMSAYAADSISLTPGYLLNGIRLAYLNFGRFFYWAHHRLIPTPLSQKLHLLLFAGTFLLLFLWGRRQEAPCAFRFSLLIVLIGILPLAINCMYLITAENSIHTLVLYSFIAVYILAAVAADLFLEDVQDKKLPELLRRLAVDSIALVLSGIVVINVYVANTAYLNMHLRYENAYAFYTSLTAQIRQMPEFREGTKLAVVGSWQSPGFYNGHLEFTDYLMGVKGFLPSDYSACRFLEFYIGFPAVFASDAETEAIRQTEAFRNMNVYPYYGSMDVIDDTIVVKLSE